MRNDILFVLLFLFSFYSCHASKERLKDSKTQQEEYIFSSKDAKRYYKKISDSSEYICCNTDSLPMAIFVPDDQLCTDIKENEFDIKSEEKISYYTIRTLVYECIVCKVIIYSYTGESDIDFLNIQINSYKNNKLIDKLLLDSRFTSEIMYYNDFTITKDFMITLYKSSKPLFEIDENGDIIGEAVNPKIRKDTVRYHLTGLDYFCKKSEQIINS